jgi:hypothetical protein
VTRTIRDAIWGVAAILVIAFFAIDLLFGGDAAMGFVDWLSHLIFGAHR